MKLYMIEIITPIEMGQTEFGIYLKGKISKELIAQEGNQIIEIGPHRNYRVVTPVSYENGMGHYDLIERGVKFYELKTLLENAINIKERSSDIKSILEAQQFYKALGILNIIESFDNIEEADAYANTNFHMYNMNGERITWKEFIYREGVICLQIMIDDRNSNDENNR